MKWAFVGLVPVFLNIWAVTPAAGQPLTVYSEFARIDAQGNVLAPETPREIISPALIRNGFTSFQIVVQVPPGTPYELRIGQNPEKAAKVILYQPVANGLRRLREDPDLRGNASQVFWMDVWIEKDAPVRRIKVEPQLFVDGDWVIYPMEMRIRENVVPNAVPIGSSSSGGESPFQALRGTLCAAASSNVETAGALRKPTDDPHLDVSRTDVFRPGELHMRNALQDLALASRLSAMDRDELRKRMGGCNARTPENPEFYLRLRDYFVTPLWMKIEQGN